jgi:hypothetical protein
MLKYAHGMDNHDDLELSLQLLILIRNKSGIHRNLLLVGFCESPYNWKLTILSQSI